MSMQLSQQPEELLGKRALVIIVERVDDGALRIAQMSTMGLPEVLDRHMPRHGKQRGRSWGWTAVIWLASILTEGDHRTVSVAASIRGMKHTLSHQVIEAVDCRDDRLGHLLQHVRKPTYGHKIARDLHARSLAVDAVHQEGIRWDATTVSGDHEVTEGGLLPCGQRKEDPTRPQITVMMGALDPLGRPLSTEVLSGESADDGFDMPIRERLRRGVHKTGLLCGGDGQMRALETRRHVVGHQDFALSPLPVSGLTAEAMAAWIAKGVAQDRGDALERMVRTNARGHEVLAAEGYACERTCGASGGEAAWTERVVVVRSPGHAARQASG